MPKGDTKLSVDERVETGMELLLGVAGSYTRHNVVAYASGYVRPSLAQPLGINDSIMIQVTQMNQPGMSRADCVESLMVSQTGTLASGSA